jgi:anthranilate phosphoribosyltransferase
MSKVNFYIHKLIQNLDLSIVEAEELFQIILNGGASTGQISSILTSLKMKGESANELIGYINTLLTKSPFKTIWDVNIISLDIENKRNFEGLLFISSLIASQAELKVIKYFNKSLAFTTNSLKFLSNLGINFRKLTPDLALTSFNDNNFTILTTDYFRQIYNINNIIEEINISSILTFIPIFSLPCLPQNIILFVGDKAKAELFSKILSKILNQSSKAWIIYNDFNVSELLKDEANHILEVKNNTQTYFSLDLRRFKFQPLISIDVLFNTNHAREIVFGKKNDFYNQVALYAALHLMIANSLSLEDSVHKIEQIIRTGLPLDLVSKLINLTNLNEEVTA